MFLKTNLPKDTTEQQIYQFLGAAINYYCPDQQPVVDSLAGSAAPAPAPLVRRWPTSRDGRS